MFGRFMPREENFFALFKDHANLCVKGTQELVDLLTHFDEHDRRLTLIKQTEKEADKVTYNTINLLHKTFITPLDREDIHRLITKMDDILDMVEDAANSVSMYDIQTVTPEAKRLADLCLDCALRLQEAMTLLDNMKNSQRILEICAEVDRLETESDHVMHAAISKLFRDEPDVRNVIKLKAMYEFLEQVTDLCEDAANIVESIVVENA